MKPYAKVGERRIRWIGEHSREARCMAVADGYVMVRHPGAMPFVMSEKEWLKLEEKP